MIMLLIMNWRKKKQNYSKAPVAAAESAKRKNSYAIVVLSQKHK